MNGAVPPEMFGVALPFADEQVALVGEMLTVYPPADPVILYVSVSGVLHAP